ncbi:serine/threonine-protein kinase [Nocardia sp. NPDC088792]|uniref:serine/threonine-protein kinase n=1 Tax=Nocardia sp. NPDC088792 TaxID=3364332 RepID=UPI00382BA605
MSEILEPGTVFAGYRIERVLGRGSMGTVYLAAHPRLPRHDALKVLSPSHSGDFEFSARFAREAELVATLEHPNVVAVYDRGLERGCLWLAMGFADGIDAGELIRRHPSGVEPARALHIVREAARGLDEAHRRGLLHRDIKPANILLESRGGEPDRVYVSDFGLARSAADAGTLTVAGDLVRNLSFAAPELLAGQPADHRADVYALGCTLFELLTGSVPFAGTGAAAQVRAHMTEPPPRPAQYVRGLPAALDAVIARALAKDPAQRYESCGALAAAATAAFDTGATAAFDTGATAAFDAGVARRTGRWRGPSRRAQALLAATVMAAVAAVVAAFLVRPHDSRPAVTTSAMPATTSIGTTSTAATSTVAGVGWGPFQYIVDAFPSFLPPTPVASGAQDLRCTPTNTDGKSTTLTVSPDQAAGMTCRGGGTLVDALFVSCDPARKPIDQSSDDGVTVTGQRDWQRSTGRGRIIWGTGPALEGGRGGILQVVFDDAARDFCRIMVLGGSTGQDLVDGWWNSAPL